MRWGVASREKERVSMVGMLQIITYLLCVYLVFKAVEILQIALMSAREKRDAGMAIGVIAIVVALAVGYVFIQMIDTQVGVVSGGGK